MKSSSMVEQEHKPKTLELMKSRHSDLTNKSVQMGSSMFTVDGARNHIVTVEKRGGVSARGGGEVAFMEDMMHNGYPNTEWKDDSWSQDTHKTSQGD